MGVPRFLTGERKLDTFLVAVYTAGAAALVASLLASGVKLSTDLLVLALYAAAAAPYLVSLGTNTFLSTSFPFVLASAVASGPGGAMVTALAASLSLGLARRNRMAFHKTAFNVAGYILSGLTAAFLYRILGGSSTDFTSEPSLRAFLGATCGFYLVNTFLVTTAVGLENRLPALDLWLEKFHWTAYSFMAGGSLALLMLLFLQKAGLYSFLILFPFCALIYHSWKVYAAATGMGAAERMERMKNADDTSVGGGARAAGGGRGVF